MKKVCAWCEDVIGPASPADTSPDEVTHGICPACKERFFDTNDGNLDGFLNRLGAPVLVLTAKQTVLAANDRALALLGKDRVEMVGAKTGDVVECSHAKLPGGCGRVVHCKACTIRNSVIETFSTGRSLTNVPAHISVSPASTTPPVRFLISTEKVNDIVLLRIDDVQRES
jgi:PAS domain-containing protein